MADETKPLKNNGKGTAVGNALRWLAKTGKSVAPELLDLAGNITGIEALENLADQIKGDTQLSPEDKELLLAQLEYDKTQEEEVTKRWQADAQSDSWWSKNIRPLTLAFLLATLFIYIIFDSSFKGFEVKDAWIDLLNSLTLTAVGGYFVLREGGKITKTIRDTRKK